MAGASLRAPPLLTETNDKAVHADPSQFHVRSVALFAVMLVSITCFMSCLKTNVKHLFCTDYAIMEKLHDMPLLA